MEFCRVLLKNGCVSQDPKLGTFTVIGSTGKPHVVKVFPQEYCLCPSATSCYHILAVKLGLEIPVNREPKKVNLTQLRWNTRANNQKRSGRKRSRSGKDAYIDAYIDKPLFVFFLMKVTVMLIFVLHPIH